MRLVAVHSLNESTFISAKMHKTEHLNNFSRYQHLKSLSTPSLITSGLLVFPVNRSFFSVFWRFKQFSICRIWGCSNAGYKEFFLGMTPCSLEEVSILTFSETCCFHRPSAYIPWRMKQHIRIEPSFISARPLGVISHKRVCFVIYYMLAAIEKCEFSRFTPWRLVCEWRI